ncbi:MAG: SDR family NAD(P)-dependent oxidoreductase [Cytophagales bacterium]|nr:SDR family NAD(P)-dependent oxidoreductase [Cytophagales bacterium]
MKTILITGSTDGIGKLVAIQLANEGHKMILHGRSSEKLQIVSEEIQKVTNNDNLITLTADLSDLDEVKKLADEVKKSVLEIDVLINNAGIFKSPALTKSGIDIRIVVNYLAPVLLTNELIPILKKETSRIINLSSAAQAPVSLEALRGKKQMDTQEAYAQSKLALTMWSFYLSQKLPSSTIIAVNPGSLLNTKMVQEAYGNFWSSAEKGADIIYQLATDDQYLTMSGKYFDNDKGSFSKAHPDAYKQGKIEELLSVTNTILKNHESA